MHIPVLQPAGPIAQGELGVMVLTLLLCALVVIPVFVMLVVFAWKYRASNPRSERSYQPDGGRTVELEILWWLGPALIILVLGVLAWRSSHALDPYKPLPSEKEPVEVQVVALDWKWLFVYPQLGIATVNLVEFPVGVPVHFDLTADAPMNSFWVPSLAGQIMVMPGMSTQLNLQADTEGDFNGVSGNISGEGFAGMSFTARAVSESEFAAWVSSVRAADSALTSSAYEQLRKPSEYAPVSLYSSVENNLYDGVMMRYMQDDTAASGGHSNMQIDDSMDSMQ